jgi:sigma-B regulation protein RsbU (phosphoserine phosphatase)
MSRWKIRLRLQVWTVSCAVVVLLAVVGWGYLAARDAAIRETRERAQFLAEGASAMLDGSLLRVAGIVEGVADSLAAGGLVLPLEELRALQAKTVEANEEVFGVCLALSADHPLPPGWTGRAPYTFRKTDGQLGFRDLSADPEDYLQEDWFRLVQERQEPVWTRPYWWDGVLMVTYSHPIFVGQEGARQLAGVATCDLTLDWLGARLAALPTGADGYSVLMDQTGLFVSHPNRELVLVKTIFEVAAERQMPHLEQIAHKMVAGEKGVAAHIGYATGSPAWVAYLPLTSTDWIFAAVVSHDGLRQRLAQLSREQLLLGVLGLVALSTMLVFIARSITSPVEKLCVTSAQLAAGHLSTPVPTQKGGDEIAELARSLEIMRSEIVRQMDDLAASTASRERMESELRIAHDIQMSLVPNGFEPRPEFSWLDLFATLEPARQVGGDFFDYFLTPSGELVVLVADVSDKGVGAALYMAAARSLIRSFFRSDTADTAATVLDKINQELAPNNPKSMFVTLFCGVVHAQKRSIRFSNAGHNPPLLLSAEGTTEWIEDARSAPVGMFPGANYRLAERCFVGGEYLVLYTDGITEAENHEGAYFEEAALERIVRAAAAQGASCQEMAEAILAGVDHFAEGAPVSDDRTLLILKIAPALNQAVPSQPETMWQTEIPKSLSRLQETLDELEETLATRGIGDSILYQTRLALEELGTNACKADPTGRGVILARLFFNGTEARLELEEDGEPFDSLAEGPPFAPEKSLEKRQVGGVGLHLLRSMATAITYQRRGNWNCTTLTFRNQEEKI